MAAGQNVQLGDVAQFIRGITFSPDDVVPLGTDGSVACMRTKNVQREIDLTDVWGVPCTLVKRDDQFLQKGDILVSTANSWNLVGKCAWVPELPWPATLGGFISALRPRDDRVDPRYLYRWFSYDRVQSQVRTCARQTTNISNLSISQCEALTLTLPSLAAQRRIAAILDAADALRQKRRQALCLLDQLTQAIFVEMFGDPVANPNGWKLRRLGDIGALDRGVSKHRPRNAPELLGGIHPLIQTGDVSNCDGYIRTFTSTYSDFGLRQSKKWPAGVLCITIAANIAKTGILTFDACFPDSVVGFQPGNETTTEYVQVWLSFLQKALEETAPESAQKNINLEILRNLMVPVPPLERQQEFSRAQTAVAGLRETYMRRQQVEDSLFASLQHRAFRGEL